MRRIDGQQEAMILGLVGELGIAVSEAALEKDCHVSAALMALTKVNDPNFDFVFCGGTCLSKSYGIVERLSEDVDIKVVRKPGSPILSGTEQKKALSKLKAKVQQALVDAGFDAEQFQSDFEVDGKRFETIKARDGNKYIVFNVRYDGRFRPSPQLRPRLQIELNFTGIVLPAVNRDAVLLIDKLAGKAKPDAVSLKTVDLKEAAVEKLLSFSRRTAMHMRSVEAQPDNPDKQREMDHTLVRHIYDIHEIDRVEPETFSDSKVISDLMATAMEKDASDFLNQHVQFAVAPAKELRWALAAVKTDPKFEANFKAFVAEMVYSATKPDFATAFATFEKQFNAACEPHDELSFAHLIEAKKAAQASRGPSLGM